ncbi:MAG TPA: dATP pyrophosphohydrolase [Caulobacteraceae bacterium]|nr:dATP pyrophosphohydrolase [Caulobacteraceae bacterium]
MPGGPIEILPVSGAKMLERFIRVPMRLNAADPAWISPLLYERREALSKKNPYFEHADVQFWLAVRDGRDVGRISAQIDHLAREEPDLPTGHFGMIAAEDDPEVFAALFAAAEAWLKARGKVRVQGPFNLSINEETGLLVEGYEHPPFVMMPHDEPYTKARIEALGYVKAKDMHAWLTGVPEWKPAIRRRLDKPLPPGVAMRAADMKRFGAEVDSLVDIYNDAWSENWNSVPITPAEARFLKESLGLLIKKDGIVFVDIDGEPAGFGVLIPDLNDLIKDLGGRLLPFGWARLLWRLKIGPIHRGRVPLMGVKKKFARDPRGAAAPFLIMDAMLKQGVRYGIEQCECGWILEDNRPMRHILENLGAVPYKTYRVYERMIG